MASDEEDDDYMNMTFTEAPQTVETSLQRRQRLKREGEIKGRVKSKAELAAEEHEAREAALSQSMLEGAQAKKSKGLAMMAKMGFQAGGALGSKENADARVEPIRPEIKDSRAGIGLDSERKRKLREAAESSEKKVKLDENEYRDRVRKEAEMARCERLVYAAMKVCASMDEEKRNVDGATVESFDGVDSAEPEKKEEGKKRTISTRPLKSIPVEWRGLVRRREEAERERRMKHDVQQTSTVRLPTYEDDLEDEDDLKATGKTQTVYALVEDLDEEDEELDEFNELEADDKLRRLVEHLRKTYDYCFWCKFEYPDDKLEGCPGLTEEEHD
ncbi:putative G-patch domain protein [Astrocystis sublimbata]|nr:putative G-patch domain protein [Astrocystis sublimbata]